MYQDVNDGKVGLAPVVSLSIQGRSSPSCCVAFQQVFLLSITFMVPLEAVSPCYCLLCIVSPGLASPACH